MPENKKIQSKKIQLKVFFWEAILFSLTLFLGIFTASKINSILDTSEIQVVPIKPWEFLLCFIIGTLFILLVSFLMKSKTRKGKIFKIIFILAIFWGGLITLEIWLGTSFISLALMIFLVFLWLKNQSILIHDICIILGIAGMGATLGLRLEPFTVAVLLVVFSFYDFIAVYKTKHMVKMAKEMIEHRAIIALVVPQNISGFKDGLGELNKKGKFLILGGGDIAFPLLLSVSLISYSLSSSLIVGCFSILGLSISFFIFTTQKTKKPIPALPPIALFSILGFLISLFV